MFVSNNKIRSSQAGKQTNDPQTKICYGCGFAKNLLAANNCLQCDRPLNVGNNTNKTSSLAWSRLPLLLLLLVSAGLGFVWRKNSASLQQATENVLTTNTSTQILEETATNTSGLQLRDSLSEVTNVPQGIFFYGGAMASAGIRSEKFLTRITEAQPQFQITYKDPLTVSHNSSSGIEMVINGTISFAESFRPIEQAEYDLARSSGFYLKQVPVATSAIAFYVNPQVGISGLSLEQVTKIYSGQITNWKQLGGMDLPIVPISQVTDAKASTSFLLQRMSNSEKKFGDGVKVVRNTTDAIHKVAQTLGAISYGAQPLVVNQKTIRSIGLSKGSSKNYVQPETSSGEVNKQAILDGSYPLIRRIFVVLREDGEIDELAGRAYVNLLLSQEGQTLIDKAGYLPIRYQTQQL